MGVLLLVDQLVAASHSGFPSGHALVSGAFGVALLVVFLTRPPACTAAIASVTGTWVLVVGAALSRDHLGVRHPTDVVGGMLLGATSSPLVELSPRDSELPQRAAVDNETTSANRDRSDARGEPPRTGAPLRPGGRRPARLWHPLWRYSWEPT